MGGIFISYRREDSQGCNFPNEVAVIWTLSVA
jgi:hypothetical protein